MRILTMMASDDPIVEVPIVFASASAGALKSFAIMETHPVFKSTANSDSSVAQYVRTVLDVGANGVFFIVDEVFGESIPRKLR